VEGIALERNGKLHGANIALFSDGIIKEKAEKISVK
jgi:hypothetical protein